MRILSQGGAAPVAKISEMLEVSMVTVRSDLKGLADKGMIVRTWGGAFPAFHPAILERQKVMVDEIVKVAAGQSEQSILLADSSKYGRAGFAHIMALQGIDGIITDTGLTKEAHDELEEFGLTVELV